MLFGMERCWGSFMGLKMSRLDFIFHLTPSILLSGTIESAMTANAGTAGTIGLVVLLLGPLTKLSMHN